MKNFIEEITELVSKIKDLKTLKKVKEDVEMMMFLAEAIKNLVPIKHPCVRKLVTEGLSKCTRLFYHRCTCIVFHESSLETHTLLTQDAARVDYSSHRAVELVSDLYVKLHNTLNIISIEIILSVKKKKEENQVPNDVQTTILFVNFSMDGGVVEEPCCKKKSSLIMAVEKCIEMLSALGKDNKLNKGLADTYCVCLRAYQKRLRDELKSSYFGPFEYFSDIVIDGLKKYQEVDTAALQHTKTALENFLNKHEPSQVTIEEI